MAIAIKLTPALNETAARWIGVLFVIAIAATAANVTWMLVPGATSLGGVAPVTAISAPAVNRPDAQQLAEQVAARHLFGIAAAQSAAGPARPVQAPETRLRLTLRGVVANDNVQQARAIIAAADGKENTYAVGQEIPGGAKLSEIHADSVLLERAGRFEVLRMPKESVGDGLNRSSASQGVPLPGSNSSAPLSLNDLQNRPLREIRDELVAHPDEVNRLVRVVPIQRGGDFKGFRVMAGSQTHLLERLGFHRGDIVTAVNGVQLDNPIKGLEAMRELTEAQSTLSITVLRNGKPQVLNISLE